ncbi:hypothetical protein M0R04_00380 [Candidatus Dojkabacteria bacterium]|nr:hypothetical protein [Candidatus Dojkabacteria bacterium]
MKINKYLLCSLVVLGVALFAGLAYFTWSEYKSGLATDGNSNTVNDGEYTKITKNEFTLKYKYDRNNKWSYILTGQLPNPCYSVEVDELVAESYPEQVYINVTVTPPASSVVCIQMIYDYSKEGTFSASKGATVNLNVK